MKASSTDATPGEFDLLDARNLMERGDYTGAVRRTVTATEAALEWAYRKELEKKHSPAEVKKRLKETRTNFPERMKQWRKLAKPQVTYWQIEWFDETRKLRHKIVHNGLRLTHADIGKAQKCVDTGRWLYNKIEQQPDREKLREFCGLDRSVGRLAMTVRFPPKLDGNGITLGPFDFTSRS